MRLAAELGENDGIYRGCMMMRICLRDTMVWSDVAEQKVRLSALLCSVRVKRRSPDDTAAKPRPWFR